MHSRNPNNCPGFIRHLAFIAIAALLLAMAACGTSDEAAEFEVGEECDEDGATQGDLVCDGGSWQLDDDASMDAGHPDADDEDVGHVDEDAGEDDPDVDECEAESDQEFCERHQVECGEFSAHDDCDDERTVDCQQFEDIGCADPYVCSLAADDDDLDTNLCECPHLDDDSEDAAAQICGYAGAECGSLDAEDVCSDWADVGTVTCGECGDGEECGSDLPNVCGCPCEIDGTCYAEGSFEGGDVCMICDPDQSTDSFSPAADGIVCDAFATCDDGECVCEDDYEVCDEECVDTNADLDHCGDCDEACSTDYDDAEASCVDGSCEIECDDDELTYCDDDDICVDLQSDTDHCGECGHGCSDTEVCEDGECEACEDSRSDAEVCDDAGAQCGEVDDQCGEPVICDECGDDEVCDDNQCICGSDYELCDDHCVDTESDVDHCGDCDQDCGDGESCEDGSCISCEDSRSDEEICDEANAECGDVDDECGNAVSCGSCDGNDQCEDGQCTDCEDSRTDEEICTDENVRCGEATDNCGETVGCDLCDDNYECNKNQEECVCQDDCCDSDDCGDMSMCCHGTCQSNTMECPECETDDHCSSADQCCHGECASTNMTCPECTSDDHCDDDLTCEDQQCQCVDDREPSEICDDAGQVQCGTVEDDCGEEIVCGVCIGTHGCIDGECVEIECFDNDDCTTSLNAECCEGQCFDNGCPDDADECKEDNHCKGDYVCDNGSCECKEDCCHDDDCGDANQCCDGECIMSTQECLPTR